METISGLLYKEEQAFPAWFYLLFFLWIPFVILVFVVNPELQERSELVLAILVASLFEILLIGFIGKITVLVKWNELVVKIGFFGKTVTKIKKVEIKNVRVVNEKLWKKYGGWGIKANFGVIAYVYSNGGGVEIELGEDYYRKGLSKLMKFQKLILSSKNPERLANAIMSMS
ncbi:hypothetical protein JGI3_01428 [Candidatus Kryptobacter tengchongensis]|uniref:Uncharacterized protein n=1 Tax=Kryptobacter tengchongensis TaxID=1643429 RepID=A0A656CX35_KRYT1|nr:hypothetical protein [Candidatus Kryptobacter tengchongensis]CUS81652.1 hypothetical protein JGI20_00725 [Candidatus Kryptobacter tengchongensis]CUT02470.1 hypothetical protein JGI24_01131 [Candidatus Kryptobacter tengchongensis]CUU07025.1 hypothetical protein JGI3_01428 [Candidatus Kryptobacter tengchongensis]